MSPTEFDSVEPQIRKVLRKMARQWAAYNSDNDPDDFVQEGLIAVAEALPRFDGRAGNIKTFARAVCQRRFSKMIRDGKRLKRVPTIRQRTEDGWKMVPCPVISLDAEPSLEPGGEVLEELALDRAARLEVLSALLSPFQREVLALYFRPTPALLAAAWNLSGSYTVEVGHMAIYLGVPKSAVEYALKAIRGAAAYLETVLETT